MAQLSEGARYTCIGDVRFHGVLWFAKGERYLCVSILGSHQGDMRYTFLNIKTRERFTFETDVMSTDINRIESALAALEP